MIYWLALHFVDHWNALNLFTYVSSRAVFAALTALLIGWIFGPSFIRWLAAHKREQPIRDDGPATHLHKNQTPTTGGILILISLLPAVLLWADLTSAYTWLLLAVMLCFGYIGWLDDIAKIKQHNSKGLSARQKIIAQSLLAAGVLGFIWHNGLIGDYADIIIPYTKNIVLPLGAVGFFVIGYLAIVGSSNAVNLTDGLDGLAILPSVMIAGGLGVFAYISSNAIFSDHLGLPYLPDSEEVVIFLAAFMGAGLAFLWFNAHPAQIFMGDVGSLAIGAMLATVAILVRQEIVFMIMSGVFVVEALSVMGQVISFKLTGQRIFRMAPLHHHFELKGWNETQVVVRFWIITIVLVLIGLSAIKIR